MNAKSSNNSSSDEGEKSAACSQDEALRKLLSMAYGSRVQQNDRDVDLKALWNIIWQSKWVVLVITALFAIAALVYAISLPNVYQSKALLAPSEDAQGGGVSRMAGQLGGLASLAGISMGGGGDDKIAVAMAVLSSRKFIDEFVSHHDILPELMAVKEWNRQRNELIYDTELYDNKSKKWVREPSSHGEAKPSSWEAYKEFMKILTVSQDKDTGFVTVSIEHQSPYVAEHWVELLVHDVNQVMKEKDVAEAERSVEFLKEKITGVALADMRTVFYQLIEEQTKTIMLAAVRDEYVFSTIDPAVVAEEKVRPSRALIAIITTFLGGVVGCLVAFAFYFYRQSE